MVNYSCPALGLSRRPARDTLPAKQNSTVTRQACDPFGPPGFSARCSHRAPALGRPGAGRGAASRPTRRAAGRRARRSTPPPRRSATGSAPALAGLPDGERAAIDGFFAARGYTPFWTEPGSPRASELIAALAAAGDQALPAGRYDAEGLGSGRARPGRPREVALTRAYLAYAGDLSAGVIDPSAVDDDITRNPVRPPAAVLLAPLATAPVAEALAGARAGRPRLPPADRREAPARGAGADRELGSGGPGRPDAASRGQRPARRRAARPAGPPRLPGAGRRDASTRASTRRSRRRSRRSRPTTASSTTASSARRRSRRSTRRSRRGWRRSRSTSSASAGCRATSATRYLYVNIPDFTRDARRGRRAGLGVEGRRRQGAGHRDRRVLRRDDLHGRQPELAHPELDRDPRLPAEAAARPDGAEAPGHRPDDPRRHRDQPEARRLHRLHARELPVPHQAAAERRQRARQGEVHVPERAFDLPARHAAQGVFRARRAGLLERLHPRGEARRARAHPPDRPGARPGGRLRRLGRGAVRARRDPRPADRRSTSSTAPPSSTTAGRCASGPTSTGATPAPSRRSRPPG